MLVPSSLEKAVAGLAAHPAATLLAGGTDLLFEVNEGHRRVGVHGRRRMPVGELMMGVKRGALAPGEMIESIRLELLDGWQGYCKVGVRNAMVIATASACLATDVASRSLRLALGSVAPTI